MPPLPLPRGIRTRFVDNQHGLRVYLLRAGFEATDRPAVRLLHGFPELAYSWRKVMIMPLAQAGIYAIAPDQRGYGRTTGWDADDDGDLASFRLLNLVIDAPARSTQVVARTSEVAVEARKAPPVEQPRARTAVSRVTPSRRESAAPRGPATAREACGDRRFIALAICIDRECERPRFREGSECLRVLEVKQRRAER